MSSSKRERAQGMPRNGPSLAKKCQKLAAPRRLGPIDTWMRPYACTHTGHMCVADLSAERQAQLIYESLSRHRTTTTTNKRGLCPAFFNPRAAPTRSAVNGGDKHHMCGTRSHISGNPGQRRGDEGNTAIIIHSPNGAALTATAPQDERESTYSR